MHASAMKLTDEQMNQIPDDVLLGAAQEAAAQVEKARGAAPGTFLQAIGNFFQSIVKWLESPDGQAFIAALAKILLGLLVAGA